MPGIAVALLTEDREQSVVLNSRVESTNLARTVLSHVGFPSDPATPSCANCRISTPK